MASTTGRGAASYTSLRFTVHDFAMNQATFFGVVDCLWEGDVEGAMSLTDPGTNTYDSGLVRMDESIQLPFVTGSELCPNEIGFAGTLSLAPTQSIVVR